MLTEGKIRRQDGQGTAAFDVTGGAEEPFRLLEGVGVHTTGEHLAGGRLDGVVGTGQAGDGIQEDDHVMAAFDQAAGFLQYHIGHLDVPFGRLVEGRCHHLGLYAAGHIGHLLGTLVNQENDLVYLGMIVGNRIGDGFEQHGLTGFRLRHDQAALAFSDRGEHVHDAAGDVFPVSVSQEVEFLVREEGGEKIEGNAVADEFRGASVDVFDAHEGEVFVSFAWRTDFAGNGIARFQGVCFDLVLRDVDIVRGIQVIVVR